MTNQPHPPAVNPEMTRALIADAALIVRDYILKNAPADVRQAYQLSDNLEAYLLNCEPGIMQPDKEDDADALRNACGLQELLRRQQALERQQREAQQQQVGLPNHALKTKRARQARAAVR